MASQAADTTFLCLILGGFKLKGPDWVDQVGSFGWSLPTLQFTGGTFVLLSGVCSGAHDFTYRLELAECFSGKAQHGFP